MTYNLEYKKSDDLLFKCLSKQSKQIIKSCNKNSLTAQELIDQA